MVYEWTMNLENGRFKRYGERVSDKLKEEMIDGSCLDDINENDLHRLPITQFKDKNALLRYIQNLTMNQQNDQQEGANNTPCIRKK